MTWRTLKILGLMSKKADVTHLEPASQLESRISTLPLDRFPVFLCFDTACIAFQSNYAWQFTADSCFHGNKMGGKQDGSRKHNLLFKKHRKKNPHQIFQTFSAKQDSKIFWVIFPDHINMILIWSENCEVLLPLPPLSIRQAPISTLFPAIKKTCLRK